MDWKKIISQKMLKYQEIFSYLKNKRFDDSVKKNRKLKMKKDIKKRQFLIKKQPK